MRIKRINTVCDITTNGLKDMFLHNKITINETNTEVTTALRVFGGLIYTRECFRYDQTNIRPATAVFVPCFPAELIINKGE